MEIKEALIDYTDEERTEFIVKNNHKLGYEIKEYTTSDEEITTKHIEAWGYTYEEKEKQEMERISGLTMTSLDLIGYLRSTGLTLKEINDFLDENLELKTQLTYCQNCYCGVVASACPLVIGNVIIDKMQVIEWFKDKNNENTTNEQSYISV